MDAQTVIDQLGLQPHPEGGFFRETYRSPDTISAAALPPRYGGPRSVSTSIHFLLTHETFSAFHRLASDEIWHFHAGAPLQLFMIHPDGRLDQKTLGIAFAAGQTPHAVISAGVWFGAKVRDNPGFSLIGCTVAPGFDFADFDLASRQRLIQLFPQHTKLITSLTRIP